MRCGVCMSGRIGGGVEEMGRGGEGRREGVGRVEGKWGEVVGGGIGGVFRKTH